MFRGDYRNVVMTDVYYARGLNERNFTLRGMNTHVRVLHTIITFIIYILQTRRDYDALRTYPPCMYRPAFCTIRLHDVRSQSLNIF